jgi:hypothetical protein
VVLCNVGGRIYGMDWGANGEILFVHSEGDRGWSVSSGAITCGTIYPDTGPGAWGFPLNGDADPRPFVQTAR